MNGTLALAMAEIRRLRRNRRYLILTIGFPVVLYLLVGKDTSIAYGVQFKAFYMVSMATFGALSGAFNNNTIRISQERKEGWIRQLRLTPLPANAYVGAKLVASMVTSLPAIVIVFLLGHFYGGVDMQAWKWLVIGAAIWFGTFIFAALAVAVGYRVSPDSVQPVAMIIFFIFSLLGGLWFPISGGLASVAKLTPTYQVVKISTDVLGTGSFNAANVIGIVVWLVIFLGLAVLAVRSTAETM
jgi:ABC-2 type transport system permease protein